MGIQWAVSYETTSKEFLNSSKSFRSILQLDLRIPESEKSYSSLPPLLPTALSFIIGKITFKLLHQMALGRIFTRTRDDLNELVERNLIHGTFWVKRAERGKNLCN